MQADIENPPVYIFIALLCSSQLIPRYFDNTALRGNVLTIISTVMYFYLQEVSPVPAWCTRHHLYVYC